MQSIAHMTVEIKGTTYGVERTAPGEITLEKTDGTAYTVSEGAGRTTCTCPDWTRRHEPLPYSDGCKHIRGLVAVGLIRNIAPTAAPEFEDTANSRFFAQARERIEAARVRAAHDPAYADQRSAQRLVRDDWWMNDMPDRAPRLADLGCLRPDGTVDRGAMWTALRAARATHDDGHVIPGAIVLAPEPVVSSNPWDDWSLEPRFTLDAAPAVASAPQFDRVAMARRLAELPSWTERQAKLADRLNTYIYEHHDEEANRPIMEALDSQIREWRQLKTAGPLPTTADLARAFGVTPPPAPQGRAARPTSGKTRGRKPKYAHLDWAAIADQCEREGQRAVSEKLGVPRSVISANIRKRAVAV